MHVYAVFFFESRVKRKTISKKKTFQAMFFVVASFVVLWLLCTLKIIVTGMNQHKNTKTPVGATRTWGAHVCDVKMRTMWKSWFMTSLWCQYNFGGRTALKFISNVQLALTLIFAVCSVFHLRATIQETTFFRSFLTAFFEPQTLFSGFTALRTGKSPGLRSVTLPTGVWG